MAQISNPRKRFMFSVSFVKHPINPYLVQTITLPEQTIEQVEHGDINYSVKTAGRITFGNLTLEKIETTSGSDVWLNDWLLSCQDPYIGGGLKPDQYKSNILISELAEDGVSILNSWQIDGCFPVRVNGQELSRMSSDNTIESIEFNVDRMQKI